MSEGKQFLPRILHQIKTFSNIQGKKPQSGVIGLHPFGEGGPEQLEIS